MPMFEASVGPDKVKLMLRLNYRQWQEAYIDSFLLTGWMCIFPTFGSIDE